MHVPPSFIYIQHGFYLILHYLFLFSSVFVCPPNILFLNVLCVYVFLLILPICHFNYVGFLSICRMTFQIECFCFSLSLFLDHPFRISKSCLLLHLFLISTRNFTFLCNGFAWLKPHSHTYTRTYTHTLLPTLFPRISHYEMNLNMKKREKDSGCGFKL